MRNIDAYKKILSLWESGYNKKQIARETGIPRATVRDCIERYGSSSQLDKEIKEAEQINTALYRQILIAWEQGEAKLHIANQLGITRYVVMSCIEKYRTLQGLEQALSSGEAINTDAKIFKSPDLRKSKYSDDELRQAVNQSISYAQTLRLLGIKPAGGNYETLKRRIADCEIDTSHFTGSGWNRGQKPLIKHKRALDDILTENSVYGNTNRLKKRLIDASYFEPVCASCGLDTWLDQPIPLELDHINGDRRDNRLENLRLLCPNCHALTSTYRGRNIKR